MEERAADSANVAVVRRGFERFNSGDLEVLFTETFDPEVSYRGDPQISALAGSQTDAEGIEGVRAIWDAFFTMFGEIQLTDVELGPADDETVIGSCRMVTQGGSSGAPIDARFYFAWVVRDGRWAFMAGKLDREEAMGALRAWKADAGQSGQ